MKKLLLLFFLISFTTYSQIPAGYYDTAIGTNYTLKTQLYNIILGHTDNGYTPGLWDTYQTSDRDIYYENDNTILDMYSEDPIGVDPYNFTYSTDQCGSYANEGDCYNREHIIPQSVFSEQSPMRNDAHFVTPTDGKVNGIRSAFPHGVVGTATTTSLNGSKLGPGLNSGYSAGYTGTVFEPIDEFKGDIARMYFYFATRYENLVSGWGSYAMFDGTSDKVFTEPFLTILMTWHTNDPVSTREIDRNNAIYARQNNRNPFIDHPEYVAQIWSTTPDTQAPTAPTNLIASNITNTTVDLNWTASTDDVGVTSYDIFVDGSSYATSATNLATLTGLTQNTSYAITVYAKDAFGNTSTVSNTENITTIIDVDAPTVPTALIVSNETSSTIDLSWTASTDNVAVTGYDVYVDGIYNATTTLITYTITGLSPTTNYSFTVLAKDGATPPNESEQSTAVNGTTTATPSFCGSETFTNSNAPTGGYGTSNFVGDNGVTWSYVLSRDDEGYEITGTGLMFGETTSSKVTSSTVTGGIGDFTCSLLKGYTGAGLRQVELFVNGVSAGTSIAWDNTIVQTFTVSGINIVGDVIIEIRNVRAEQVIIDDISWTCFTGTPDTEAPTAIVDLSSSNTTSTTTDLAWTASTDNVGVTSYEIFKDGIFLASSATNSYNVTGLTASTSYNFTVYANDAAGNTSLVSNTASVTTLADTATETVIYFQGFEGTGNDTWSYGVTPISCNDSGNDVWDVVSSVGSISTANTGTNFFGVKDLEGNCGTSVGGTISFGDVDLSAHSDVTLSFAINVVGFDVSNGDIITYEIFHDNVSQGVVTITIGSPYSTTNWENISIDVPNSVTSVKMDIYVKQDGGSDYAGIDDVQLIGTATSSLSVQKFVNNLFTIYPNPTKTNSATIAAKNNTTINAIQLYNLLGQLIVDIENPNTFNGKIEVTNIPSGFYIVKVSNEKAYSTKRLIVQ